MERLRKSLIRDERGGGEIQKRKDKDVHGAQISLVRRFRRKETRREPSIREVPKYRPDRVGTSRKRRKHARVL